MTVRNTSEGAEENYKKTCSWIKFKRNHWQMLLCLMSYNQQAGDGVVHW